MEVSGTRNRHLSGCKQAVQGVTMPHMADEVKKDRHKKKPFQLRLHDLMKQGLEVLATRNGSDVTEEIRIAIRKHLADNGLWPPRPAKGEADRAGESGTE